MIASAPHLPIMPAMDHQHIMNVGATCRTRPELCTMWAAGDHTLSYLYW